MRLFDKNSSDLISDLKTQKKEEIEYQNYPLESDHNFIYRQTTNYLVNLVQREYFINDDQINEMVYRINDELMECNPTIRPIKKILVKRDGFLNAVCFGEGTIALNIGLTASVESEEELAFVIAHEIAHHHLNHLRERIDNYISRESSRKLNQKIRKIPLGLLTLEDLQYVQTWFNTFFENSRANELEADSLAIQMFRNCGYQLAAGTSALNRLKFVYQPPNPLKKGLFDEFIFEEYAFKKRWLRTRKAVKSDDLIKHLINNDSIETHPDIDVRIERISNQIDSSASETRNISQSINRRSKVELIYSFYKNGFFDFGVHTALQLKAISDSTSQLDLNIGRMLYEIALAKNDNRLPVYVRSNTAQYPPETKALNNFFYNLTFPEAAELSYFFLKRNFDPDNPSHYQILYRIHELTNRLNNNKELKRKFKKRFPKESITKYPNEA